ncbi:MAG: tRNA (adenosine(37)-N6)-threonylcarbamoyltransferase complex dimerization subunit type 1 TsaB [bacterium]|nr:tRNA (adenosine(37)-N6)-threonylcarbamoyltransferase complex dimerization subunit type 1 TsaB [bacterium]
MPKNPIIFGIDAAREEPCFSAVRGPDVLFSKIISDRRQTAAQLVPLMQESLEESSLSWSDIDRLCVTTGPGSFTGIRIALATALGLNLGSEIPVVGVSTFDLWRWHFEQENSENPSCDGVLIALFSGRKDVYGAIFKSGEMGYLEKGVWSADVLVEKLNSFKRLCVIGSGQGFVREALTQKSLFFSLPYLTPETLAFWGGRLTQSDFQQFSRQPLEPFYLKAPDVTLKR